MKQYQIRSKDEGLFLLVEGKEIYPINETFFKLGEYVSVRISKDEAILTDPGNSKYTEIWELFHPVEIKTVSPVYKLKLIDLVEDEFYFITTLCVVLPVSFYIGLFIGWLMLKMG